MIDYAEEIQKILTATPKTFREIAASLPDRVVLNDTLLLMEKQRKVRYDLATGYYRLNKVAP